MPDTPNAWLWKRALFIDNLQEGIGMIVHPFVISQSFRHIVPRAFEVTERFFDLLVRLYPEFKPIFESTDMRMISGAFLNAIIYIVDHLDEPENLKKYLMKVGKKHSQMSLRDDYFDKFRDTFLRTLSTELRDKWTQKVATHWDGALTLAFHYVKLGAGLSSTVDVDIETKSSFVPLTEEGIKQQEQSNASQQQDVLEVKNEEKKEQEDGNEDKVVARVEEEDDDVINNEYPIDDEPGVLGQNLILDTDSARKRHENHERVAQDSAKDAGKDQSVNSGQEQAPLKISAHVKKRLKKICSNSLPEDIFLSLAFIDGIELDEKANFSLSSEQRQQLEDNAKEVAKFVVQNYWQETFEDAIEEEIVFLQQNKNQN